MPYRSQTYIAHCVPGLEEIAGEEIVRALEVGPMRVLRDFDERTSVLLFPYAGAQGSLLHLGTVEDVFALAVESDRVPTGREGFAAIRTAVAAASTVPGAVECALAVRPRKRGKTTFRVIARKSGDHAFRRVDVQRAVERGMLDRFSSWRLVEDDAQLEVWVSVVGRHLLVGIRLSDGSMRNRDYRAASLPAALKPTVARAMALLSEPNAEDVVLDPMCGAGTILIERARAARYRSLLGGDIAPEAVDATLANVGPRYKPIEIKRWDARHLPLPDSSVSTIITNMPFGKQIGTIEDNRTLYPACIADWVRVLQPGGCMVLLTGDRTLLTGSLRTFPHLAIGQFRPVLVRGYRASLVVVRAKENP